MSTEHHYQQNTTINRTPLSTEHHYQCERQAVKQRQKDKPTGVQSPTTCITHHVSLIIHSYFRLLLDSKRTHSCSCRSCQSLAKMCRHAWVTSQQVVWGNCSLPAQSNNRKSLATAIYSTISLIQRWELQCHNLQPIINPEVKVRTSYHLKKKKGKKEQSCWVLQLFAFSSERAQLFQVSFNSSDYANLNVIPPLS